MQNLRLVTALSLALVFGSTAALADDSPAATAAAPATTTATAASTVAAPVSASAADPDSVVLCRTFPPPTGTMLGARRICKTRHDWKLDEAQARELTGGIQTRGLTSMPVGPPVH